MGQREPQYHLCQAMLQSITEDQGLWGRASSGPVADDTGGSSHEGERGPETDTTTYPEGSPTSSTYSTYSVPTPLRTLGDRPVQVPTSVSGGFSAQSPGTPPRPLARPSRGPSVTPGPSLRRPLRVPRPKLRWPLSLPWPVSQVAFSVPCPTLIGPSVSPARFSGGARGGPSPALGSMATLSVRDASLGDEVTSPVRALPAPAHWSGVG